MTVVPNGWMEAALDDVCQIVRGITFPSSEKRFEPGAGLIACLRTANVQATVEWDDLWFVPRHYVKNDEQLVLLDDILISTANSYELVGKVSRVTHTRFASSLGAFISLLRAYKGVDPRFLYYQMSSESVQRSIRELSSTTTNISNVSGAKLKTLGLRLAPAAEQTRIVAKLEELLSDLDAGVAELKAAQKKLQQYRQSLLKVAVEGVLTASWRETQRAANTPLETGPELLDRILRERFARWEEKQLARFKEQGKTPPKDWRKKYPEPVAPNTIGLPELPEGWAWASVEQVASDERYSLAIGPFGSNLKVPDYRDSGVPLVFVRNIRSGKYGGEHTKYVTSEKAFELNAHSVKSGDVLVTKMGEPPGDADVYPDDQPPAIITADCIKIRCWNGLMRPDFLKSVINSHIGKQQIEPITQGVAQKKVSLGRFSSLALPVPPAVEQVEIELALEIANREVNEQLVAIELALKQSTAQRQNILRAAFAGQLVPQDPNDEPASVLLERIRSERAAQAATKKPRGRKKVEAAA